MKYGQDFTECTDRQIDRRMNRQTNGQCSAQLKLMTITLVKAHSNRTSGC